MSEKQNKKKELNLFDMAKNLNEKDKALQDSGVSITEDNVKLIISNQLVEAKSHPGGGVVSMGVTAKTLMNIITPTLSGKSSKICVLLVIDKKACDDYKQENGFT